MVAGIEAAACQASALSRPVKTAVEAPLTGTSQNAAEVGLRNTLQGFSAISHSPSTQQSRRVYRVGPGSTMGLSCFQPAASAIRLSSNWTGYPKD